MRADWYFDFISPYAYLQFERLPGLPDTIDLNYHPVLFAGLLNHWGQLGPAEIPAKRLFTYRHVRWLATRHGVALSTPKTHPFNPLKLLRLALVVGNDYERLRRMFRFIWCDSGDLADADQWRGLCRDLDIPDADTLIQTDAIKLQLKQNTDAAIAANVFGVPSFVAAGQVIWGNDATAMMVEFSRDPELFNRVDMRSLADVPQAAVRRRPAE